MVSSPDVLVLGEVLVELTAHEPLRDGATLRLAFSGDALNAAGAAAAAGAATALLARVPDDELGDDLVRSAQALGIDTSLVRRVPGQHGLYLQHADPSGAREFVYARSGSAGSGLHPDDLTDETVAGAGAVLASGVTCAVSASARAAVERAAGAARVFVYDPNWRPGLIGAAAAAKHLRSLAPYSRLVTPAWPREARALLGVDSDAPDSPAAAAAKLREWGADAVAVTLGSEGVLVDDRGELTAVAAFPPERIVDQTGAGDVLTGTVTARMALGDPLVEAVRLGAAAAALSLQGQGGTGHLAGLADTRRLVRSRIDREVTA